MSELAPALSASDRQPLANPVSSRTSLLSRPLQELKDEAERLVGVVTLSLSTRRYSVSHYRPLVALPAYHSRFTEHTGSFLKDIPSPAFSTNSLGLIFWEFSRLSSPKLLLN